MASHDYSVMGPTTDDEGAPSGAPIVAVEDIAFGYPDGPLVADGISLAVREGCVTGLVGPSGCGKTTLLSLLAGLLEPNRGRLVWTPDTAKPPRHPLTMLFQQDTLLPWLTTEQNVGLHYRLKGSLKLRNEQRERIAELIRLVNLEGAEHQYPYQLSGGMRRRAAFLAAVAPQPRALLLDEPFSSLDEPTRVALHQESFDIIKRFGIGVVLVTHDLAEAISLCDEVLILSSKPARVVEHHEVPFGDRRNIRGLREDPEFLQLYGLLWHQLNAQIEETRSTSSERASSKQGA